MKMLTGLIVGLLVSTSAVAQDASGYQHDGLYPDFRRNSITNVDVEFKRNFYLKNCVTVSKEPIDRICDVRVGNFEEEIPWKAPIKRETIWSGGRDVKMTWLFAAADRPLLVAALDEAFGPMPAEIARPNTWCSFSGLFTLAEAPEGVIVRFDEAMSESDKRQHLNSVCGQQIATDSQKFEKEWDVVRARGQAIRAVGRLGY